MLLAPQLKRNCEEVCIVSTLELSNAMADMVILAINCYGSELMMEARLNIQCTEKSGRGYSLLQVQLRTTITPYCTGSRYASRKEKITPELSRPEHFILTDQGSRCSIEFADVASYDVSCDLFASAQGLYSRQLRNNRSRKYTNDWRP